MKNLTRILTAILLVIAILTSLAACNETDHVSDPDSSSFESTSSSDSSNSFNSNESSLNDDSSSVSDESLPANPQDTVVSILACPDNIIHPSVFYDALERAAAKDQRAPDYSDLHNAKYDFSPIYEDVAEQIKNADIAYINQETLIGGTSGKIIGYPCFNSPKPVADEVIGLGFDVVNVAHNHMLDSGDTRYLENCSNTFENAGLEVIGYYPDEKSTESITVLERDGIRIAFLAYTYGTNGIRLPSNSSFIIPYLDKDLLSRQVSAAKSVADVIIVSCHWGYEDTFNANSQQKEYATLMCELGVDVVLGMHPHVIQPMEWMTSSTGSKTLVVYSLGNFVSGMVAGKNMLAGMLSLNIVKDAETKKITIEQPTFIPIVTHYIKGVGVASNDTGYRSFKIYYLNDYTEELAATHGVCRYERGHGTTLVGGAFSKETLIKTLKKYIPAEFLPIEFQ